MNLFIPVTSFRVDYEVGVGEPYSKVYSLVLRAIDSGEAVTEQQIADWLELPQRLVIEILVGLSKAGLVAIQMSERPKLVTTSTGREAITKGNLFDYLKVHQRRTEVLMECVTGGIARMKGIRSSVRRKYEDDGVWDKTRCLPNGFADPRIDEGQVAHLLRPKDKDSREYVRWIATPEIATRNQRWLLVDADLERGRVFNLPEEWRSRLEGVILEHVKDLTLDVGVTEASSLVETELSGDDESEDLKPKAIFEPSYPASIEVSDITIGEQANLELLKSILHDAHSSVIIVSSEIDPPSLEGKLVEAILGALARGVQIDLLWGAADKNTGVSPVKWLHELSLTAGGNTRGLRFNTSPSTWRANAVIADRETGEFSAAIGSLPWLSVGDSGHQVSVKIHEAKAVSHICRSVAGLWHSGPDNALSSVPDRWRQTAAQLEGGVSGSHTASAQSTGTSQAAEAPEANEGNEANHASEAVEAVCEIAIVRDQDHPHLVRMLAESAQYRLGMNSPSFGSTGFHIFGKERELEGLSVSTESIEPAPDVEFPRYLSGRQLPRIISRSSNVMVADLVSLISSYPIAGSPSRLRRGDIGILIQSGEIADHIWENLFAAK